MSKAELDFLELNSLAAEATGSGAITYWNPATYFLIEHRDRFNAEVETLDIDPSELATFLLKHENMHHIQIRSPPVRHIFSGWSSAAFLISSLEKYENDQTFDVAEVFLKLTMGPSRLFENAQPLLEAEAAYVLILEGENPSLVRRYIPPDALPFLKALHRLEQWSDSVFFALLVVRMALLPPFHPDERELLLSVPISHDYQERFWRLYESVERIHEGRGLFGRRDVDISALRSGWPHRDFSKNPEAMRVASWLTTLADIEVGRYDIANPRPDLTRLMYHERPREITPSRVAEENPEFFHDGYSLGHITYRTGDGKANYRYRSDLQDLDVRRAVTGHLQTILFVDAVLTDQWMGCTMFELRLCGCPSATERACIPQEQAADVLITSVEDSQWSSVWRDWRSSL